MMKERLIWVEIFIALLVAFSATTAASFERVEQDHTKVLTHEERLKREKTIKQFLAPTSQSSISSDTMKGPEWGHPLDGLRARVLVPSVPKRVGEQVSVIFMLRNEGSSKSADGSIWIAPTLKVTVFRNHWRKSVFVPVSDIGSYLLKSLEKGKEFYYMVDLARVMDLTVPGEYEVIGGYDSSVTKQEQAWKGSQVESLPYNNTVEILPREKKPAVSTWKKLPQRSHRVKETEWGREDLGLRCKISVSTGAYSVAEPISATIRIKNLGVPEVSNGTAQLFPHLDLWIRRAGWQKHVIVNLDIKNRLLIKKGGECAHSLDLSKEVDLTVPGEYAFCAGHANFSGTDIGDWVGLVRSPWLNGIFIAGE